jgi:putative ABC transport system permease protein
MKPLRRAWHRLIGTFAGTDGESQLNDEFEIHLQMQTEDNLREGMTPAEARRAAVLKFGGLEGLKEDYREQRGVPSLGAFGRDLRYGLRALRNTPGFTVAAVLSLALGIAAATAIFSVADAVLIRPLPYKEPGQLARITLGGAIPGPAYEGFRRNARSIESAGLFVEWTFTLTGHGDPVRIPAARVTSGLFETLGVRPRVGRTFRPEEDQPGNDKVVILGDSLWKSLFGADPGVLNRSVLLNGVSYRVIGIMPPGFQFPDGPELESTAGQTPPAQMWRPMWMVAGENTCDGCFNFAMLARLRRGVSAAQTRAELVTLMKAADPKDTGENLEIETLQSAVTRRVRMPVIVLFAAVTLALLIACVNVASLLLARGLQRQNEIALRLSLGASRGRIVRQLLTEGLVLALIASALAIPLAWTGLRVFLALAPPDLPRMENVGLDGRVLGFALLLGIFSALIAAGVPAFLTARHSPGEALKTGSRVASSAPARLRYALIASEFALSLVLLVAAGLLARSFLEMTRTKLGFETRTVLTMRFWFPDPQYNDWQRIAFAEQLVAYCKSMRGVNSAAMIDTLPLTGGASGWGISTADNPDKYPFFRARMITPDYFRVMGIPLKAGRLFTASDQEQSALVAVLTESAAQLAWPNVTNPIGRRFSGKRGMTVVGIVGDTRASGIDVDVVPYLYVPFAQVTPEEYALVVGASGNPMDLASAIKSQVRRLAPAQAVTKVETMQQVVDAATAPWRFEALLMATFAVFALVLAAVGIYGVLSYSVARRTNEVGIRIALGESRVSVVFEVMKPAGALAVVGAVIGLIGAIASMRFLRSLLYGVAPAESSVLVACAAVLLLVGFTAAVVPARRAANLDPMQCLRNE